MFPDVSPTMKCWLYDVIPCRCWCHSSTSAAFAQPRTCSIMWASLKWDAAPVIAVITPSPSTSPATIQSPKMLTAAGSSSPLPTSVPSSEKIGRFWPVSQRSISRGPGVEPSASSTW